MISGRREQRLKEVQELIEKDGAKVLSVVADVSKKSEVFGLIEKVKFTFY